MRIFKTIQLLLVLSIGNCAPLLCKAQDSPFKEIAGRWTNDLQLRGQSAFTKSENFFWVGRFWGVIEPTGKMVFRSDNNCTFEGLATPYINSWEGQVSATGCNNASMNRVYSLRISKVNAALSITGQASVFGVGRVEATYEMKSTLSRY